MKILVSDPIDNEGLVILSAAGFQVRNEAGIDRPKLAAMISEYEILVIRGRTKVDASLIKSAPRLKIIGRAGVGLDNVDVQAAKNAGISVINTPGAPSTSVAELTIALMLSLLRRIPLADSSMKEGRWIKNQLL